MSMHRIRAARSFFSSCRSCSERLFLIISVSGSSAPSSSSSSSPAAAPTLLFGPLSPLGAWLPAASRAAAAAASSALLLRPLLRFTPDTWLPDTMDVLSTSTDGERAGV
jgi:hypothetical protein